MVTPALSSRGGDGFRFSAVAICVQALTEASHPDPNHHGFGFVHKRLPGLTEAAAAGPTQSLEARLTLDFVLVEYPQNNVVLFAELVQLSLGPRCCVVWGDPAKDPVQQPWRIRLLLLLHFSASLLAPFVRVKSYFTTELVALVSCCFPNFSDSFGLFRVTVKARHFVTY
jgi:hypothetical protein